MNKREATDARGGLKGGRGGVLTPQRQADEVGGGVEDCVQKLEELVVKDVRCVGDVRPSRAAKAQPVECIDRAVGGVDEAVEHGAHLEGRRCRIEAVQQHNGRPIAATNVVVDASPRKFKGARTGIHGTG